MPGLEETRSEATEEVDKIANLLTAHHSVLSTPLSCRGAGGESVQSYTKIRSPLEYSPKDSSFEKTAATYSPTGVQYHRRGRA